MLGCCVGGGIVRDVDLDVVHGPFNRESFQGGNGFRAFEVVPTADENMVIRRGEEQILSSLEANTLVGTCEMGLPMLPE